jgi:hypothetical protein
MKGCRARQPFCFLARLFVISIAQQNDFNFFSWFKIFFSTDADLDVFLFPQVVGPSI